MDESEVKSLLKSLPGVLDVVFITPEDIERMIEIESSQHDIQIPIVNKGIIEMRERDMHFILEKDHNFRPPGEPTFYLVRECEDEMPDERFFEMNSSRYLAVGQEIIGDFTPDEGDLVMSGSFLFYKRHKRACKTPVSFLFPALPFPELETRSKEFGMENIISATPSAPACGYLDDVYGIAPDINTAFLIIGFNNC